MQIHAAQHLADESPESWRLRYGDGPTVVAATCRWAGDHMAGNQCFWAPGGAEALAGQGCPQPPEKGEQSRSQ